jgi:hypothetical protein
MMLTLTNQSTPGVPGAQLKNSKQPLTRDDSHATLLALLDEGLGCWPEYRAQLSSHLPMALDALQQLGASSARLREFNAHYGARLQPMPTTPSAAERPQQFGRIDDYPQWFAHYRAALAADGRDALLRAELPALMAGVGAVAFHGLIRAGHALRHGHAGELAAALAYWASRHQPLPEPSDTRPLTLTDWLAALRALPGAEAMPKRGLISERMADWSERADWQAVAARLPATELPALARAAAALYAATASFTVLHMVTASAALLALRPWLDESSAYPRFISAAAAALMASGAVQRTAVLAPVDKALLPGWAALAAGAIAQHDDHVIKLVAACHALEAADSAPVWHAAAARALRPTEPQAP